MKGCMAKCVFELIMWSITNHVGWTQVTTNLLTENDLLKPAFFSLLQLFTKYLIQTLFFM